MFYSPSLPSTRGQVPTRGGTVRLNMRLKATSEKQGTGLVNLALSFFFKFGLAVNLTVGVTHRFAFFWTFMLKILVNKNTKRGERGGMYVCISWLAKFTERLEVQLFDQSSLCKT